MHKSCFMDTLKYKLLQKHIYWFTLVFNSYKKILKIFFNFWFFKIILCFTFNKPSKVLTNNWKSIKDLKILENSYPEPKDFY